MLARHLRTFKSHIISLDRTGMLRGTRSLHSTILAKLGTRGVVVGGGGGGLEERVAGGLIQLEATVTELSGEPFGLAVRLVSRRTSVRIRFGSPFSSEIVVCGHSPVTLSLTIKETLKWLLSLPILMQKSFWW